MRDPLSSVPIRYKLALLFLGVCLLAFGVGGLLVSRTARAALTDEIELRLESQCRAAVLALDAELDLLARRAEDFASDGFVRARLEELAAAGADPHAAAGTELRRHLIERKLPLAPSFVDLAVLGSSGLLLVAATDARPAALRATVPLAVAESGTWTSDLLPAEDPAGAAVFAIGTPVHGLEGGAVIGRLIVLVDARKWAAAAGIRAGPHALALTDRHGVALGMLERRMAVGKFFSRTLPLRSNGWLAEVRVPADSALLPVARLQSRLFAYGVVLAAVAVLLLSFPLRFLAKPIGELGAAARRIRDGDFSTRVPVRSTDEIGELQRSFNHMAEALEERAARLGQAHQTLRERRMEAQAERDRLDTVIHSLRDGLLVLDGNGKLMLCNRGAEPLAGLLADRGLDVASHNLCHEQNAGSAGCRDCLFDPGAPARSCVIDTASGVFEVHATLLPPDRDGRCGRVFVSRDISDRVQQDERQIHQERLAVLGEVAAVMAHELNNPLAAISMFDQMLLAELPEDSPLRENAEVILRNTETCKRTIRELLDYATGATPEVHAIDIQETLRDVERFLRPVSERSGVTWDWRLRAADSVVSGDEIQIRQVFVNLIMNALQSMEGSGGTLTVSSASDGERLSIDVADTGPGIDAATREEIFRPFFTTKLRGAGTGLGLPTSRRIAEMHGGSLDLLESAPGRTVFRVRLRRRQNAVAPAVAQEILA
ncbi:MAG TPA: ATP-binding protein [Planctomycetota bacterium]